MDIQLIIRLHTSVPTKIGKMSVELKTIYATVPDLDWKRKPARPRNILSALFLGRRATYHIGRLDNS